MNTIFELNRLVELFSQTIWSLFVVNAHTNEKSDKKNEILNALEDQIDSLMHKIEDVCKKIKESPLDSKPEATIQ